jgi:hypothetical protein
MTSRFWFGRPADAMPRGRQWTGIVALGLAAALAADAARADRYDEIVDRFIAYDIGQLGGEAGAKAYQDFTAMNGKEAIPAVVRGVNKAARIQASCPIIVLSAKLRTMLAECQDRDTLQAAVEGLDATGRDVYYAAYVESLAQEAANRLGVAPPEWAVREIRAGGTAAQLRRSRKPVADWSFADLSEGAGEAEGAPLVAILEQLRDRKGAEATAAFASAIEAMPDDRRPLARGLFAQRLVRMTDRELTRKLKDPLAEVRAAGARAIFYKGSPLCLELAQAVADESPLVAAEAHATLVKLSGQDLGPKQGAPFAEWYTASKRWEQWIGQR